MTKSLDDGNIGGIEIILNGVSVKLEITLVYLMRSTSPQILEERG